jgi:hypothetical protein
MSACVIEAGRRGMSPSFASRCGIVGRAARERLPYRRGAPFTLRRGRS